MKKCNIEKRMIPSPAGKMKLLIIRPTVNAKPIEKTPAILWIHGGGYATGSAGMIYISRAIQLVKKYGAVVVTPEYRLSGKAPYPAALDDCYCALEYLKEHAEELGCNKNQIMIGGESAGGGMTAALCMYARDKGDIHIAYQMPLYPMLDDRDTDSSRDNHGPSWNTKRNHKAWSKYLRDWKGEIAVYAAPARQTDFEGLPPAYTFVGDKEPFYCETMTYIENLKRAGIDAKVDVYSTAWHAFDLLLPMSGNSKRAIDEFEKQYLYAAEHYFYPQE